MTNGKTENYSILTQRQPEVELSQIPAGESNSELTGGNFVYQTSLRKINRQQNDL